MIQAETDLRTEDLAAVDPAYWAVYNKIRLQKGTWSFARRDYLMEPMQSRARRICSGGQ